jgi:hypothetical protein
MKLISSFLSIPKRGSLPKENEDFFFPHEKEINRERFSIAIADGASEGFLSNLWSKVLTISYVNFDRLDLDVQLFTDFCIDVYNHQRERYIQRRRELNNPLKWFEENLMTKGSFSTLLGVTFIKNQQEGGYWKSYSIGDSCLFQIRDTLIEAFPTMDPLTFGNSPDLISSNPAYNEELESKIKVKTGAFVFGDSFYLMTDAIASWFLTLVAEGEKPWEHLEEYFEMEDYDLVDYINSLREDNRLKNDDTTIARLKIMEE